LHRAVEKLLPAIRNLLAERDDLAARFDLAHHDPVTGLPARAAWTAAAEQLLGA
jgi:GGDEF domain-containing protein